MSNPRPPATPPRAILTDPRSTGGAPMPRLPDVLGLRGTLKR